jgi:hypothetical protein
LSAVRSSFFYLASQGLLLLAPRSAFSEDRQRPRLFSIKLAQRKILMNMHNLKWILLGIFLIITGLGLLGLGLGGIFNIIAGICALIAGVLFIINR